MLYTVLDQKGQTYANKILSQEDNTYHMYITLWIQRIIIYIKYCATKGPEVDTNVG